MYQLKFCLILNGFSDYSNDGKTKLFLECLKHVHSWAPKQTFKEPISFELLVKMLEVVPIITSNKSVERLLKAMFSVAFHGLLRIGEVSYALNRSTVIMRQDVSVKNDFIRLPIHNMKTAKAGEIQEVELMETGDLTCPVTLLKEYLAASIQTEGPLFEHINGQQVSSDFFQIKLNQVLHYLGVDQHRIKGHSFCQGGAPRLKSLSASIDLIMFKGRWTSDAYKSYINTTVTYQNQKVPLVKDEQELKSFLSKVCLTETLNMQR